MLARYKGLVGTDPEMFVLIGSPAGAKKLGLSADMVGSAVPAWHALGRRPVQHDVEGNSYRQIPLTYGKLIEDGMAVEFTVDPSADVEMLVHEVAVNISEVAKLVQDNCRGVLSVAPQVRVHPDFIEKLDTTYGTACSLQILGCSPDWEIYNSAHQVERPDPKTYPFRTSGGHIHLEVPTVAGDQAAFCYMVACLDRVIGTASAYLCTSPEAAQRMELYGRAGSIRNYPTRIEYRTLPAQALIANRDVAFYMFAAAQNIAAWFEMVFRESASQAAAITTYQNVLGDMDEMLRVADAINRHDVDACRKIQSEFIMNAPAEMDLANVVRAFSRLRPMTDFSVRW